MRFRVRAGKSGRASEGPGERPGQRAGEPLSGDLPSAVGAVVERSRFALRDLFAEAVAGVLQRPGRSALTALGTVLGVGTFVAILGLTATASSQIDSRFNSLTATEVTIEDTGGDQPVKPALSFPGDADRRVERLHGVEAAGVYWTVDAPAARRVRAAPVGDGARGDEVPVLAASSGVLRAARATLEQGRIFDSWHDKEQQQVAVIGAGTAARLGITTLDTRPAVFIGEIPFSVIGIVGDVDRKADLLLSVVVPRSTATALWGPPTQSRAGMLISTRVGAAVQIAEEAPIALRPDQPGHFKAVPPPDPRSLRTSVTSDLDQLFLVLAAIVWSSEPWGSPTRRSSPCSNAPGRSACGVHWAPGAVTSWASSSRSPGHWACWADWSVPRSGCSPCSPSPSYGTGRPSSIRAPSPPLR